MSSDMAANMRAAAEMLIMSFDGPWSAKASVASRAPDCEHVVLPSSMGTPKRSNDDFVAHINRIGHLMQNAKMTITDSIIVPDERRAVFTSSMSATTPAGPYYNEYVWILTFDESGHKIIKITEFFDSKAAKDLLSALVEGGHLKRH